MAEALFFEAKRREEAGQGPAGKKLRQRHCGLKATASAMVHRSRGRWAAGLPSVKETPAHYRTVPVLRQANGAEVKRGPQKKGGHRVPREAQTTLAVLGAAQDSGAGWFASKGAVPYPA
ncbi:MAG: hypothetical protein IM662_14285 [Phenylobacterium sp.]|nr:hypothetical protein [Phenylobacterium sp.]MCA6278899.1 hypothetical protein [Phenylobacterium sp.]MCA6294217.1 hypothetical protein [Phenylobacterium sp.]